MKKLNKKGFTIVELVIVIAVIAILAGVLIPTFATVVDKANQSKAMQETKNAYELYLAEHADKSDLETYICITNGEYVFHVENGTFIAEAKQTPKSNPKHTVESASSTPNAYAVANVSNGTLTITTASKTTTTGGTTTGAGESEGNS